MAVMDDDPSLNQIAGEGSGHEVARRTLKHENLIAALPGGLLDADQDTTKVISAKHHHHTPDGWRSIHRSLLPRGGATAFPEIGSPSAADARLRRVNAQAYMLLSGR